jgi:2,4-didehydro-3-deoxy-L-rhamnonate hydrolase
MKLIRIGPPGKERPAVLLHDRTRLDVSQFTADYDESFFADDGIARLDKWLPQYARTAPHLDPSQRLGPPISHPSKIICVGLNFRDHAAESKLQLPGEPALFAKATSSLAGPNDAWSCHAAEKSWITKSSWRRLWEKRGARSRLKTL